MKKSSPIISVIMSVYNTKQQYLKQAIDSILNQSFSNFEFIIINDGSNLNTEMTLREYTDKRIKIYTNHKNIGLPKSLNIGLSKAKGKYIARMDADDISLYDRLFKQYKYMEKHSDVIVVGAYASFIDTFKMGIHTVKDPEIMKMRLLFQNSSIVHPTAFIRKELLDRFNIRYDENLLLAQDYDLWVECFKYGNVEVVPEVLLNFRSHPDRPSNHSSKQEFYACITKTRQLRELSNDFSKKEEEILCSIESARLHSNRNDYITFFNKLISINNKNRLFSRKMFKKEVKFQWFQLALKRLKQYKELDILINRMTLKVILTTNWLYLFKHTIGKRLWEVYIILKAKKKYNI